MAVGIIIGAAFGKIVSSSVGDLLMPPLRPLLGKVDFSSRLISLSGQSYHSLTEAKAASTTRECPFCTSAIPVRARRCPHCTSALETH